jgi:hypothetical protein
MAVTPKVLAQAAPSAASLTDFYTCPDGVGIVAHCFIANRSATPTALRVSVARDGATDGTSQYIAYDKAILGNAIERLEGITLSPDDVVRIYATLATLSFTLFGLEIPEE